MCVWGGGGQCVGVCLRVCECFDVKAVEEGQRQGTACVNECVCVCLCVCVFSKHQRPKG